MIRNKRKAGGAGLAIFAALVASAAAAPDAGARARADAGRLLDSLQQCQAIADPTQRLACFDAGIGALKSAREEDRTLFEAPPAPVEFSPITANLDNVAEVEPSVWLLVLSDHSIWRTDDDVRFIPAPGVTVHVVKAALGSYMATIGKEHAVRVVRRR